MKLTTEQIAQIEETLVLNGLVYQDVKLELLDHIASEIEERLSNEEISFDIVNKSVFEKWEQSLEISSSGNWLGAFFKAPRVVIEKLVTYSKMQVVFILMSALVFGFVLALIVSNIQSQQTFNSLNLGLKGAYLILVLATVLSLFLIWYSKIKTTYGRLFLYRGWLVFLFFFQFNINNEPLKHFDNNNSFLYNFISCLLIGFPFTYSFFQLLLTVKHYKIVKKLKLV
jgi:hypothetical protein